MSFTMHQSQRGILWLLMLCIVGAHEGANCSFGQIPGIQLPGADGESTAQATAVARIADFPDWVTSVAFSSDSKLVAAGSYEVVKLYDVATQKSVADLKVRGGFARSLCFTNDDTTLIVGGYQSIELWDVKTAKRRDTLKGQRGYVTDLAIGPNGVLASSAEDETVRLWDLENNTEIRKFDQFTYPVTGVAWSPDGKQLATVEGDETRLTKPGLVKLWDVESGDLITELPQHSKGATAVSFTPSGHQLLTTSLDERVHVYDVEKGEATGFFGGHSRPTNGILITEKGTLAISGSGGRFKGKNEVQFWSIAEGEVFGIIDSHELKVSDIALASDGKTLAVASYDKTVSLWDITPILQAAQKSLSGAVLADAGTETDKPMPPASTTDAPPLDPKIALPEKGEIKQNTIRFGIIGLDTSHSIAFAKELNAKEPREAVAGCRVIAAYPHGSADIESSASRIPNYTKQIEDMGIAITESVEELVDQVDVVLLETNDGRLHLEQALIVMKAGKPLFIDKPISASLVDCIAIYKAAEHYKVPVFSSSSLRWMKGAQEVRNGSIGKVYGCDAYSPCSLESTHPELYWYGIHGVEALYTVMGVGCETVTRASTTGLDQVTGTWADGRIGTFRGIRDGKRGYGAVAFGEKAIQTLGPYAGYGPLVEAIVHFANTHETPVTSAETIEIYTFMEAADESKRQAGKPVALKDVYEKAEQAANEKLKALLPDVVQVQGHFRFFVSADGGYRFGEQSYSMEELQKELSRFEFTDSAHVTIQADSETTHADVVQLLDYLTSKGVVKVSLSVAGKTDS